MHEGVQRSRKVDPLCLTDTGCQTNVRKLQEAKATDSTWMWGLTRFNKITIQGTPQMAVDKESICLSIVYS